MHFYYYASGASGRLLCIIRATSLISLSMRDQQYTCVYIYVRYDCDFRRLEREIGTLERIKFVPDIMYIIKNKLDKYIKFQKRDVARDG